MLATPSDEGGRAMGLVGGDQKCRKSLDFSALADHGLGMTESGSKPAQSPAPSSSLGRGGHVFFLGTNLAVGMALFTFLGYVLDQKRGGGVAFTLCGALVGIAYGAYEVWKTVQLINARDPEKPAGPDAAPKPGEGGKPAS